MGGFALLVIFAVIFIVFVEDIVDKGKALLKIGWFCTFGPLFFISCLWAFYDAELPGVLTALQTRLNFFISQPASLLPQYLQWVARGFGLFVLASIPVWVVYWRMSRNKKAQISMKILTRVYAFSWLCFSLVILA